MFVVDVVDVVFCDLFLGVFLRIIKLEKDFRDFVFIEEVNNWVVEVDMVIVFEKVKFEDIDFVFRDV